ncbi:MAG: ferrochelatase [Candidatus Melainabacteria bacterium]|nr:ferrochelatase [Candidatus Melainabacteria bacterium]
MTLKYDAVLMVGFGGPTAIEEVRPFIQNIVGGRPVPPERIEQVVEQYRVIGGKSPFNELTQRQARALEGLLSKAAINLPVYLGMLYWKPYVRETIERMLTDKRQRAIGIIMAPHRSEVSFERYVDAVRAPLKPVGSGLLSVDFVAPWHNHKMFIEAVASRVKDTLGQIPENRKKSAWCIFTAHSIPADMGGASEYVSQVQESATLVSETLGLNNWLVAYQSRSGPKSHSWLEPDIKDALLTVRTAGATDVVVVPIGFVCDHAEVLFDLDVAAQGKAKEIGLNMFRAATVGEHPKFIELLGELVQTVMSKPQDAARVDRE